MDVRTERTETGPRAAGQVGTPIADAGGACLRIPPLRQARAASPCCAAGDALGLGHWLIVKECSAERGQDDGGQTRATARVHGVTMPIVLPA
jgi:hypothetical protein